MDATVVYLRNTGHVLTAVTCGNLAPTLAELTLDGLLRLRFPGTSKFVDVPILLLEVARLPADREALDHPQSWVVTADGTLAFRGTPTITSGSATVAIGDQGKPVVDVWQMPDGPPVTAEGFLDGAGKSTSAKPESATERLVAFDGGVLHLVKA